MVSTNSSLWIRSRGRHSASSQVLFPFHPCRLSEHVCGQAGEAGQDRTGQDTGQDRTQARPGWAPQGREPTPSPARCPRRPARAARREGEAGPPVASPHWLGAGLSALPGASLAEAPPGPSRLAERAGIPVRRGGGAGAGAAARSPAAGAAPLAPLRSALLRRARRGVTGNGREKPEKQRTWRGEEELTPLQALGRALRGRTMPAAGRARLPPPPVPAPVAGLAGAGAERDGTG